MKIRLLLLTFILVSCVQKQEKPTVRTFPKVNPPAILTSNIDVIDYLVTNYWGQFPFADTTWVNDSLVLEQAFADYIWTLSNTTPEKARKSIKGLLTSASVEPIMFNYFTDISEKYLYDPNSPLRNEEIYIGVLESLVKSNMLDSTEKIRPLHQLDMAYKNRVGSKAINFKYLDRFSREGSLYNIKAPYTLIFINNPGCNACAEISNMLQKSPLITDLVDNKELILLAVYPDEDITLWKSEKHFPDKWIDGYDHKLSMRNDKIYDIKAIPTLYLLDKDKVVLLKDANVEQVMSYIGQNYQAQ